MLANGCAKGLYGNAIHMNQNSIYLKGSIWNPVDCLELTFNCTIFKLFDGLTGGALTAKYVCLFQSGYASVFRFSIK